MRIAIIAGCYPPDVRGGGEISSKLLADILVAGGCDVSVMTCAADDRETVEHQVQVTRIRSPNVYWHHNAQANPVQKLAWHAGENFNPRARARLTAWLARARPDLVVTSTIENFGAEAWRAPAQAGVPSVHVLRSYYPFCWRGNAVRRGANCAGHCVDCAILSWGRKQASRQVNGVIGISRAILQRHLAEGFFGNAATALIPEPITRDAFAFEPRPGPARRFGYLGVLSRDKGLETLAAAWREAPPPGASLHIAGTGAPDYEKKLRAMFPPEVAFASWVDSGRFLAEIDVLVVPSVWNEPFGRIVIEAFAKAVPVVGSAIGGIAETITEGATGFTFPTGDSDALATLLRHCAALPAAGYQHLSAQALAAAATYDATLIGEQHIAFYQRVITTFRGDAAATQRRAVALSHSAA